MNRLPKAKPDVLDLVLAWGGSYLAGTAVVRIPSYWSDYRSAGTPRRCSDCGEQVVEKSEEFKSRMKVANKRADNLNEKAEEFKTNVKEAQKIRKWMSKFGRA